jgi:hypothetical protein
MTKIALPLSKTRHPGAVVGTLVVVALVAAACGGSPAAAKATTTTTAVATTATTAASTASGPASPTTVAAAAPGRSPAATTFGPAASGTIASILGQDLEVQGTSGQTTVDVTAKTAITATVSVRLSDITPGTCISATGTKAPAGKVDATLITVEPAVKGNCTEGGFGSGGFRGAPGGAAPTRTTGTVPARFRAPTNVAGAFGKVTSISGSTITVQGISLAGFGRPASGTTPTSRPKTTPKASPQTVIVSSKTKYSKSERVTSGALKVGECATAFGSTNDIGVVTATRLTVTQPVNGSCSTGLGFRGGFGGGAGRGASGGGSFSGSGQGGSGASAGATS